MTEAEFPSLIAPRDRTQICNYRKINLPLATEYLSVMHMMMDKASIITRLSLERGESPIILLSKDHQIQELKRCCSN